MKNFLAILMAFIIAFAVCSFAFASEDRFITTVDSVTKVPEGWTAIRTAEDLNNVRNDLTGKYILMNDIDLSVYDNWSPIGDAATPFTGTLDGNGYTIENMKITQTKTDTVYAGFFGKIQMAEIRNLIINGSVKVSSDNAVYVGIVSAVASNSVISNCITYGSVEACAKTRLDVGGFIGTFNSTYSINKSVNYASITTYGENPSTSKYISYYTGGIAGNADAEFVQCANYGSVFSSTGEGISMNASGGICGHSLSKMNDCYNIGEIKAIGYEEVYAGGIIGFWESAVDISNLYNVAKVTAEPKTDSNYVGNGAIVGFECGLGYVDEIPTITISNSYYLDNVENGFGEIYCDVDNVVKLSKDEFNKEESFEGFDFEKVWAMDEELGRPVFINENIKETTTEATTSTTVTEPTTEVFVTESTTEKTTITEVETTQPKTENNVGTTTEKVENTTEEASEAVTEPNTNGNLRECWIVRLIKQTIAFVKGVVVQVLGYIDSLY